MNTYTMVKAKINNKSERQKIVRSSIHLPCWYCCTRDVNVKFVVIQSKKDRWEQMQWTILWRTNQRKGHSVLMVLDF